MIGKLVSKIAGPRVLVGIVMASAIALGTLGYMLLDARSEVGSARAVNAQLRGSLAEATDQNAVLRETMAQREAVVARAQAERDEALARVNRAQATLRQELSDDQCANTDHPDAVFNSLQLAPERGSTGTDAGGVRVPAE